MIPFEEVLCQLILKHQCVIVPNFGGFVSKPIPASIDFDKGVISAPFKQLLFNRNLMNDDGLLLSEYARLNGLFYQEGVEQLSTFTKNLNADLQLGKQVSIPKIGLFSKDQDGVIRFEQDRHFNHLLSAYGLSNIQFVPQKETPIITMQPKVEELPKGTTSRNLWKYAAAACLLPLAFYSFWIPMKTDVLQSGLISYRDFNPFRGKVEIHYHKQRFPFQHPEKTNGKNIQEQLEMAEPGSIAFYEYDEESVFAVKLPTAELITETSETPIQPTSPSKFEFIVGCFSDERNANNFVQKLRNEGFAAHIVPGGSLMRVSAGGASTQIEIQEIQQKITALGIEGWICKL